MLTLAEQGFRFLVNPSSGDTSLFFYWVHPAEVEQRIASGWKDCTDMSDAEYEAFISSLEP